MIEARAPHPSGAVVYGTAGRALPGERESGDLHVVVPFQDGILVALADGLGHGSEAAEAARIAAATLCEEPQLPAADLVLRCHAALRKTRGVVLGLASIDTRYHQLSWIGIGNIDATLTRADRAAPKESLPNRGGVVGYQMPPLRVTTRVIAADDTLVLLTDGIDSDSKIGAPLDWSPQELADHILAQHAKQTDDALALVVRYVGSKAK